MSQDRAAAGNLPGVRLPSPYALNHELADGLRGTRLVLELGVDESRYQLIARSVESMARRGYRPAELCAQYPALYVAYLVFTGVFRYVSGTFWSDVHPNLTGQNLEPGGEFRRALRSLQLETFDQLVEQEKAQPWVTRILAHGGIPKSCLRPFLELLNREIGAGAVDATELLASWRVNNARLTVLHQPTRRFLLYGGQPAVDLLDRCIELLRERRDGAATPSAQESGLPQYVVDEVAGLAPDQVRRARTSRGLGVPRPVVRLDPYSGLGPTILLPAVSTDLAGGSWRVDTGVHLGRYEASALTDTPVRLSPARSYSVEFVSYDDERRLFTFEALGRLPVLLLDPSTERLLRDPSVLAADEAWVLSPPGIELGARKPGGSERLKLREVQELPGPAGPWSGWSLRHVDLEGVGSLELIRQDTVVARIPVTRPRERPALVGPLIDGVSTVAGSPVYSAAPRIEIPAIAGVEEASWQIRVHRHDERVTWTVEGGHGLPVLLEEGLGDDVVVASVRVRGPLGFDLREDFAVVPGLEVKRPTHVIRPEHDAVTISARAATAAIDPAALGEWCHQPIDDTATFGLLTLRPKARASLELRVSVARLLWALVHDGKPAVRPAAMVVRVGSEEFDDQLSDLLVVNSGVSGTQLELELRAGSERLLSLGPVTAASREGRWSFDLGPFTDPIRRSSEGLLEFWLQVNGWPVRVADVVAKIKVSHVQAHTRIAGEFIEAVVSFEEERDVKRRIARLWSEHRPWDRPLEAPIADGEHAARFGGYGVLAPGPYLAEVAIADSWARPTRPLDGGPAARTVTIGSREEITAHLEVLDPADPLTHMTWALSGHEGPPPPSDDVLLSAAAEISSATSYALIATPRGDRSPAAFRRAAALLCSSDRVLCAGLVDASEDELVELAAMARMSVRLLEVLDPTSEELDPGGMSALWRASPPVAACLDVPWAGYEGAQARCETFLGWVKDDGPPPAAGGQVSQLEMTLPAQVLQDLRRELGLQPAGLLDPAELQSATFEWLLAQAQSDDGDDGSPRDWYYRWRRLLRSPVPANIRDSLATYLAARLPAAGSFEWGALPAVTLMAAAHLTTRMRFASLGVSALDEALQFAPRLVTHDLVLSIVLRDLAGA